MLKSFMISLLAMGLLLPSSLASMVRAEGELDARDALLRRQDSSAAPSATTVDGVTSGSTTIDGFTSATVVIGGSTVIGPTTISGNLPGFTLTSPGTATSPTASTVSQNATSSGASDAASGTTTAAGSSDTGAAATSQSTTTASSGAALVYGSPYLTFVLPAALLSGVMLL